MSRLVRKHRIWSILESISLKEYKEFLKSEKKGRNRYGNKKKEDKPAEDGFVFDSNPELYRYRDLKLLVRAGEFKSLKVQPIFTLKEKSVNSHGQKIPKWTYKADYSYYDMKDVFYVEDVKSLRIEKKNGKTNRYGTATERGYILSKNEFMRLHPGIVFVETIY